VYGGTISPGTHTMDVPGMSRKKGDHTNIADNFEAIGAFEAGLITDDERASIVRDSCPGPVSLDKKDFKFFQLR